MIINALYAGTPASLHNFPFLTKFQIAVTQVNASCVAKSDKTNHHFLAPNFLKVDAKNELSLTLSYELPFVLLKVMG